MPVAIIASGVSAKLMKPELELLRGKFKVLVIKKCIELAPWADAIYGCDGPWWRHALPTLKNYKGLKVCWSGNGLGNEPGMIKVDITPPKTKGMFYSDQLEFGTGKIAGGGNSGFQALNLVINWGARNIILVGFDCHDRGGIHWYGKNRWPQANNPNGTNFGRWKDAFAKAAHACEFKGIKVYNASKGSDLTCFKRMTLAEAIALCEASP